MSKFYGAVDLGGMANATAASRWVGGTTAGPPTAGTWKVGDFVVDQAGGVWVCTGAGTPGTWVMLCTVLYTTLSGFPSAAAANVGQMAYATDVTGGQFYRSNGSAWQAIGPPINLGIQAKGAFMVGTTGGVSQKPIGSAGQLLMPSTADTMGMAWTANPYVGSIMPTGALAETFPRAGASSVATVAPGTGVMMMQAIWLPINLVVTSISYLIGTTALATGTHSWAALYNGSTLALLRQSTDVTSPVAAINTVVTFTLSSTFTTTFAGFYYLGVMWAASTMPTLAGVSSRQQFTGIAPIITGTTGAALTGTAPSTASALTSVANMPYAYVA